MASNACTIRPIHGPDAGVRRFRSAVSLHAHTFYSRETLAFVPDCAARLPVVSRLFEAELRRYRERTGQPIDFCSAFWRPPLMPEDVLRSEQRQIRQLLDLDPLVSITDHDGIKAGLMLRRHGWPDTPISVEWTAPFESAFLHIGVHNLPQGAAHAQMRALAEYTRAPVVHRLGELLDWLGEDPATLVVLNHPFWDLESAGDAAHEALVLSFMEEHGQRIHAVELNGMQPEASNRRAADLAHARGLPLVAGGDRHGRAPNAMLNITRARQFAEFVDEVRRGHRSDIVVTAAYRQPLLARRVEVAADLLRAYPDHAAGRPHWTDRLVYARAPGGPRRLSHYWEGGPPVWVRALARTAVLLGGRGVLPALRVALRSATEMNRWEPRYEWRSSPIRSTR